MLLTVRETAYVLSIDFTNVYYLISRCYIDGVKIRDDWRVSSESLREFYDKRQGESSNRGGIYGGDGLRGFDELLANITENRIQNNRRKRDSSIQRGRGMEFSSFGCDRISRQSIKNQLEFDF